MLFASVQSYLPSFILKYVPERYRKFVPKRLHKYFPETQTQKLSRLLVATGIILLVIGIFLFTIIETSLYIRSLQKFDLLTAQNHANNATPLVQLLSVITFSKVPDIEAWKHALVLGKQLGQVQALSDTVSQNLGQSAETPSLAPLIPTLSALSYNIQHLKESIDHSYFAKKLITPDQQAALAQASQVLTQLDPLAQNVLTGKQTWVVVFQNSDELRAAGGFAGSYALITLQDGKLSDIVVEDIYDADGQFLGYLPAPSGMREYTSSSRGLRLPDANWFPHFPHSAQTMLQFFAFGNKRDIKGVITVNLPVAETILRITGPLYVPDYDATVTAENIHSVLREGRDEFFPGSIQKKHILAQAVILLRQKLLELPAAQQVAVIKELLDHTARKEIQVYAINPELQSLLSSYGITGELGMNNLQKQQYLEQCSASCESEPNIFFLVESNVGINKANRYLKRSVIIAERETTTHVTIEFQNTASKATPTLLTPDISNLSNPAKQIASNGYANYQRLIISPDFTLKGVTINNQKVEKIDFDVLEIDGKQFNQYGFLAIVLPGQASNVEFTLQPTTPNGKLSDRPLLIQKQSGLSSTPYTILFPEYRETFILEKDRLITWQ